MTDLNWKKY